jgi:protein-S-isoprenylcysteine O-methyltransferase Ste14
MFSTRSRIWFGRLIGIALIIYVIVIPPPEIFSERVRGFSELFGFMFLCIAAVGRIWCACFITGKKNNEVVTSGPYSVVRNPLYVFSFIGIVGFGFAVQNPILAGLLGVIFVSYYNVIIKKEEKFLLATFGESYADYFEKTPRWIPNFSLFDDSDLVTISAVRIRREILDAIWFLAAFFLWQAVELVRAF